MLAAGRVSSSFRAKSKRRPKVSEITASELTSGLARNLLAQRVGIPDGADLVGVGDRLEVDQDRLAGEADRGERAEPLAVDADRLGAGRPERVDDQLQVAVADPAAGVFLGGAADRVLVGLRVGVGQGDQQAGPGDPDGRGPLLGARRARPARPGPPRRRPAARPGCW